ncbi:unnamed protein product [Caenorhabditis angaria]|uniref:C6 domain-containing protein n=1 Tax=Caenorhabditis angaria TaxID=860376 RepID=A0A9P1IJ91_9PELO|nr:unnamed protein product [Caenorhabditis angaria]
MCCILILILLVSVTFGCAPHRPSRAFGTTTNHHHRYINNYYTDNRTYYGSNENQNLKTVSSTLKPTTEKIPETESDCQTCTTPPEYLVNCENCANLELSDQYEYYACSAINVKCAANSVSLKISNTYQYSFDFGDSSKEVPLTCQKGKWIYTNSDNSAINVEVLSCLTS